MKTIRRQLILAISMVFLVLAVCSAAAAAEVSDNGTQIQAQNQTTTQLTSHNSTNISSVQTSTTNSSQSSTTNTNSIQTSTTNADLKQVNATDQPSKVVISGKVTKCSDGSPFEGVTVTAEKDGVPVASTTTKEDGTYSLEFPNTGGMFNVTASYPGHESSTKEVTVNQDSNSTLRGTADFQLGLDDVYVSPTGSDITGDGTQANPYQTIGKGINEVNAGGTVHLADGTYNLPNDRGLTINKDVTIVGQSQAGTIIDAGGTSQIFYIPSGNTVTLQNLTLENGNAFFGGAIYNQGDLTVNDCTFDNNTADRGGAIWNRGTLTVNDCTFTGNTANHGGAIENDHALTVISCTFTNNTAGGDGGAIENWNTLTVTGSTFTGNTAVQGGAIRNWNTLTVSDSTFTGNTANMGGAIFNEATSTVSGSTFTGNTAGWGGAIINWDTLTVSGSTFTGNTAYRGGAIENWGTLTAHFNHIVGNSPSNSEVYSAHGTIDARFNWWGSNTSPAGKISTGPRGVVLFDPWLVLSITANPTTLFNGGTSQVTADLQHDSNGVYHDPALGHVPDGIPITLTTDWGSFTNPTITHSITLNTVNGSVTATFYANEGPTPSPPLNPVKITATADGYTTNDAESAYILILTPLIIINIGDNASILSPHQSQSQGPVQTQTQNSTNTNNNNLTNENTNALSNVNTFDPVILSDNSNHVSNLTINSFNVNSQIQSFIRRFL